MGGGGRGGILCTLHGGGGGGGGEVRQICRTTFLGPYTCRDHEIWHDCVQPVSDLISKKK